MAWFDYVKNLGQGIEQVGQNISNRQVLDAEQKRKLAAEQRAVGQDAREKETFEREKVKYLLDTVPDDWTSSADDPTVQAALKLGFKNNLRATPDGRIGIAETPERKQRKLTMSNMELTHQKLIQDFGEDTAKLQRQETIRTAIQSGDFYKRYPDPQLRKQELSFAGLPEILAYKDAAEKQRWDRIEAENQGGVMAARINAGADIERAKIAAAAPSRGTNPATLDMDQFTQELGRERDRIRDASKYLNPKPTEEQIQKKALENIMASVQAYPGGTQTPTVRQPEVADSNFVNMVDDKGAPLRVPKSDVRAVIAAGGKLR